MLTFLSTARLQEFNNLGQPLAGGTIESYELGTSTPKPLFQDINGEQPHTNPLILDAYGSAEIYLFGSYTIVLKDSIGNLISSVDIAGGINDFITSGGSGTFADNIVISVNTYNDVRALTNPYAWVFVQGRELQADGGQGLFYIDTTSSESDDDGITLQPGITGRYIRYNVTNIEPTWFGLVYNDSTDQSVYLDKTATASIRYARPVLINDSVYINSNYTVTSGSEWIFSDNSKMVSTLSVNMTFPSGSKILECGRRVFGNSVQPIFGKSIFAADTINYSIFDADNVEGRIAKLEDCTVENYFVRFDEAISTSTAPQLPGNFDVQYSGNVVTITSNSPLSYRTSYTGVSQLFGYNLLASVGTVSISGTARPEHFGGDTTISLKAIANNGTGLFLSNVVYTYTSTNLITKPITFLSESSQYAATIKLSAATSGTNFGAASSMYFKHISLQTTNGYISATSIQMDGCISKADIIADSISYTNSYIDTNFTIITPTSAIYLDNTTKSNDESFRWYTNKSAFEDVYLTTLSKTPEYTTLLGIDSNDKVITIDNIVLSTVSATNGIFENYPITRKLNPTRIDFRWLTHIPGTPKCDVYRNNILVNSQINPLTATYTITSADGPIIIGSTSGSTIGQYTSRILLTTAVGESITQDLTLLQDGSVSNYQVGGDVTAVGTYPGLLNQQTYGTKAYYDSRSKKWILT